MINQYQRDRQQIVDQLQNIQQQLTDCVSKVKSADTVADKLAVFDTRDQLLEQQRQLQLSLARVDSEEIQRISQAQEQPRFRPASR
jgi:hypothetical protein